jgi:hypothetical protein
MAEKHDGFQGPQTSHAYAVFNMLAQGGHYRESFGKARCTPELSFATAVSRTDYTSQRLLRALRAHCKEHLPGGQQVCVVTLHIIMK